MTKADLVNRIHAVCPSQSPQDITQMLNASFNIIKDSVVAGDTIFIRGFGNFTHKRRSKRKARNIHTNTTIVVEAKFYPAFKPSKEFIQIIKTAKGGKSESWHFDSD